MGFFTPSISGKASFTQHDIDTHAITFHDAMKGLGTNESKIIKEITSLNNQQRQVVKERYASMFNRSLEKDLKSELRGDFEDIVIALLKPRFQYEAECIHHAIRGFGTNERVVIQILCTKESSEIELLKQAYKTIYGRELEDELKNEEHGDLGRIFRTLAAGDRPSTTTVDPQMAQDDAQALFDAGEGKLGTDEGVFVNILSTRSFAQLRATFEAYQQISKKDIEESIVSEMSGNLELALQAIVESIRNRPVFFAKSLHHAIKGIGSDEQQIIRLIVSRSEIDLIDIRREYKRMYHKSLYDVLKSELSGDLEKIVLILVGKD